MADDATNNISEMHGSSSFLRNRKETKPEEQIHLKTSVFNVEYFRREIVALRVKLNS